MDTLQIRPSYKTNRGSFASVLDPLQTNSLAPTWTESTHTELPSPGQKQEWLQGGASSTGYWTLWRLACLGCPWVLPAGPAGTPVKGPADQGPGGPTPEDCAMEVVAGAPVRGSQWSGCGAAIMQFAFLTWLVAKPSYLTTVRSLFMTLFVF